MEKILHLVEAVLVHSVEAVLVHLVEAVLVHLIEAVRPTLVQAHTVVSPYLFPGAIMSSLLEYLRRSKTEGLPSSEAKALRPVDHVENTRLSTQYKVLDIARPLVRIWSSLQTGNPLNQPLESALCLWGVALNDIMKNRRKHILHQTAPDFLSLLTDPSMFPDRETSQLFGVQFMTNIAKEAEEEAKLARVGRTGGSRNYSGRQYRGRSSHVTGSSY
ncbi:hypothetical protein OUZ56_012268 [Daphnia magna]|uniref:Uncharacterized protein n=1 Tax=Daphnia magna TaxID=35525 RepID=A0ABQ9Z2H9_9CRUS|nr:hypothetical protein OUZ56_012268 [Daphnia magna]